MYGTDEELDQIFLRIEDITKFLDGLDIDKRIETINKIISSIIRWDNNNCIFVVVINNNKKGGKWVAATIKI